MLPRQAWVPVSAPRRPSAPSCRLHSGVQSLWGSVPFLPCQGQAALTLGRGLMVGEGAGPQGQPSAASFCMVTGLGGSWVPGE